ncbi:amino acid ABC transporter permease [Pseudarthrobacter sulfonivorans]|uniref:amino acid ABC transporter permease n=1 Tax=Pseudarthrobacter sulfonivorans TaxID=121292 RepID=UPI00285A4C2A|nr:amino acid ABC transporter permease [Pseudarthrobacter sulfonivorans]MDR6414483.1 His/Glu/Gln/Arg/opine family amino acid ABC transporter permease subunit [Pseudarthrobacter sulfonivorans]
MIEAIPFLLQGLGTTVIITFGSFLIGAVCAVPVALARLSTVVPVRWLATAFIEIVRGIPPIAWMLVLFYGLGRYVTLPPLLAACLALGAVSTAYLAENYRAGIQAVAGGQWEGAGALGLSNGDTFWRVIAPQGIGVALPPSASYAVGLLKDSAVASVIGVSDIAFQALTLNQQGNPGLPIFLAAGVVYLIVSVPMAVLARKADTFIRTRSAV